MNSKGRPSITRNGANNANCGGHPSFRYPIRPGNGRKLPGRIILVGRNLRDPCRSAVIGRRMSNTGANRRPRNGTIRKSRSVIRHSARGRKRLKKAIVCDREFAVDSVIRDRVRVKISWGRARGVKISNDKCRSCRYTSRGCGRKDRRLATYVIRNQERFANPMNSGS